ncbi:MAG: hypothetical protein O7B79_00770 [SAR324 cluster bacterium]|nr:hypothetical protein [SAR324 cluster bacterium]
MTIFTPEFVTCASRVGNDAGHSDHAKWVFTGGMLLSRLELVTLFVLFCRAT